MQFSQVATQADVIRVSIAAERGIAFRDYIRLVSGVGELVYVAATSSVTREDITILNQFDGADISEFSVVQPMRSRLSLLSASYGSPIEMIIGIAGASAGLLTGTAALGAFLTRSLGERRRLFAEAEKLHAEAPKLYAEERKLEAETRRIDQDTLMEATRSRVLADQAVRASLEDIRFEIAESLDQYGNSRSIKQGFYRATEDLNVVKKLGNIASSDVELNVDS